ncbi:hypothetical protein [Candidatus Magnetobacterium casense]|uniref:Uncharacterized protein n=1 Tax=Candidatus Magnetobacterium casense TaxID=1455061 RepID=A0ABS6S5E4_9BACT|nr:hypothetical protein [Candidatus Magnetobacterium casensis]MBV6343773.1 hypothetical protein [Candidatus Magnetobacterium casensis]
MTKGFEMDKNNDIEKCENCECWHYFSSDIGLCRAHPPKLFVTLNGHNVYDYESLFPEVAPTDWCGEYYRQRAISRK